MLLSQPVWLASFIASTLGCLWCAHQFRLDPLRETALWKRPLERGESMW